MILIFIGLFGAFLYSPVAQAKEYHVDFTKFCNLYGQLDRNNGYDRIKNLMLREVRDRISKDLLFKQGLPSWHKFLKKHCAQRPNYLKDECLAYKRRIITTDNGDWNRFFWLSQNRHAFPWYVNLWLLHPQMRSCAQQLKRPPEKKNAKAEILKGLLGKNARDYAKIFTKKHQTSTLRDEIVETCGKENEDPIFCPGLLEMVRMADTYELFPHDIRSGNGVKWTAYQLQIALIKRHNPQIDGFVVWDKTINGFIVKIMEQIFTYASYRQKDKIRDLIAALPEKPRNIQCDDLSDVQTSSKKIECIFWKTLNVVRAFVESTAPMKYGNGSIILNTNIDYPRFLGLTQMTRILATVQNQNKEMTNLAKWVTSEVKKTVNNRFKELRAYFQSVASFNKLKAKADIDFIKKRLEYYQGKVTELKVELCTELGKIVKLAFLAVGTEISENIVQVGLATAHVMNPLEKIFGGGSMGSLMDRTAKLANSFTNLVQLRLASKTFEEIRVRTNEISKKLGYNDDFLNNLNTLINVVDKERPMKEFSNQRNIFLKNYSNYNPQVKRHELTAMTVTYGSLVDECCEVILSQESTLAQAVIGEVKDSGRCPKTKEVAEKMFATFAEIYDFQFDLIEAMAVYMRAANAYNAASGIAEDYDKLSKGQDKDTLNELKALSIFSFTSYKINIWDISDAYCHILTYKEGGHTPKVCQQKERNIARLASYSSPICRNTEAYRDVPDKSKRDQGFMDLSDLYAGRDVIFKIPNSQWLVDNNWISPRDKDSAIVIKKLEVFLPTDSSIKRNIRVVAKDVGDNRISVLNGIRYAIVPSTELVFDYMEGKGSEESCRQSAQVLNNPYGSALPKLCRISVDENNQELLRKTTLFPSVYSRWKINVYGYESAPVPEPANDDFKLKVGVRLCILKPRSNDQGIDTAKEDNQAMKVNSKFKDEERPSCPKPKYWAKKLGRCVSCPKGSRSELDGYFCVKIPKTNG